MKRNKIALAALAVTALANMPNAQAQTWDYQRTSIQVSGKVFSTPQRIVYDQTTYMPIYYVGSLLQALGMTQSWNGTTHLWSITTGTGASVSLSLDDKSGNTSIVVNGQTVAQHVVIVQATDPDSGVVTTFMPIWYVQQLLNALGFTTDTWDGSATPPTWTLASPTPIQPKVQVVKAFAQALGISPDASGSNPYDDVSVSDWGYVHAAVEQGYFTADSSTHFGSSDDVTLHDVDHAYQLYAGIPDAHMSWNAGGNTDAWGNVIGLNKGLGSTVTLSSLPTLRANLTALHQGYWQDSSGLYHMTFIPYDAYTLYSDGMAPANKLTASDVASGLSTCIEYVDKITFSQIGGTTSDPTFLLRIPGVSATNPLDVGISLDGQPSKGRVFSSIDGGTTWQTDNNIIGAYDSRDSVSGGGVSTPPQTILIKAEGTPMIDTGIVSPDLNHPGYQIDPNYAGCTIFQSSNEGIVVKSGEDAPIN